MQDMEEAPTVYAQAREWVSANKLKAFGGFWGACLAGSMAYQWGRPVPFTVKVFHSRVYAQAAVLAGLVGLAYLEYTEGAATGRKVEKKAVDLP